MIYPSEIETGKGLRKTTQQFLLIFRIFKKKNTSSFISKHNSTREKQIILLMIHNKEKEG